MRLANEQRACCASFCRLQAGKQESSATHCCALLLSRRAAFSPSLSLSLLSCCAAQTPLSVLMLLPPTHALASEHYPLLSDADSDCHHCSN